MSPSGMSSGGGVAAERMTVAYSVVQQVGEGFVHCIVSVSWKVWPHAMSVIVVRVTAGGAGQTNVERIPQRPVGQIVMKLMSRVLSPNV